MAANQKLQLALITETTVGGVRKHVMTIAKNLDRERFHVTVIMSVGRPDHAQETDFATELEAHGIDYQIIPMVRRVSPGRDFRSLRHLREVLLAGQFDVVHAHGSKAGFLARKVCAKQSTPCIYSPHVFAFTRASQVKSKLYFMAEKLASRWESTFVVNADWEKECAISFGLAEAKNIYIVPNAIEPPAAVSADFRATTGTQKKTIVFLTIGRLVAYKGQGLLLRAFARIAKEIEAEVWFLGEGKDQQALMNWAETSGVGNKVRFLGYRKNVYDILAASDCFVLPSQIEGSPYTLLEALALEKPVIATNVPGTSEILKKVANARLVEWNNVAHLADALRAFAQSPYRGTPGTQLPPEWFDVPRQIRALEEIYIGRFIGSIRY